MAPTVFVLVHREADNNGTTNILSVFSSLEDANAACLARAVEASVTPAPKPCAAPETLHWELPDGEACWVERHSVTPRKTSNGVPASPQRKGSRLYDSGEDDEIEVKDEDGHYD